MKKLSIAVFIGATLLVAVGVAAEESKQASDKAGNASAEATKSVSAAPPKAARPVYRPPAIGKPAHTVGGGSRGSSDKVPSLYVVAPDHVGQTISAEPSLFWFIDRVPEGVSRIEFTVLDEESIEPKAEKTLKMPKTAGVHRIRLSDYGVKLDPGTEYQWSVALILDPNERSKDIVATGWIDRVESTPKLASRLASEGTAGSAAVYADEGLWYDALAALSDEIDRNPGNAQLKQQRADLLLQVGLEDAAKGAVQ